MARALATVFAAALACAAPPAPPAVSRPAARPAAPIVVFDHPREGAVSSDETPLFATGRAFRPLSPWQRNDVVLVLDTSGSTATAAQGGPPASSRMQPAPPDSVLAVEVEAARALLTAMDLRTTRVAIITFDGYPRGGGLVLSERRSPWTGDARTVVPLIHDRDALNRALDDVVRNGCDGMTHAAAGLEHAVEELVERSGAVSEGDEAGRIVVYLTDGMPTLPYLERLRANEHAVIREAEKAARHGVVVHSYGVGQEALEGPRSLVEVARRTGGIFTPVRDPRDLPAILPGILLGEIEAFEVRNRTLGKPALAAELQPDGSFDALVHLAPGPNEIEALVRDADGAEARALLTVERREGGPEPTPLTPELLARRGRLLDAEALRVRERARIALEAEIRRERAAAEDTAERQGRELEIEAEPETR